MTRTPPAPSPRPTPHGRKSVNLIDLLVQRWSQKGRQETGLAWPSGLPLTAVQWSPSEWGPPPPECYLRAEPPAVQTEQPAAARGMTARQQTSGRNSPVALIWTQRFFSVWAPLIKSRATKARKKQRRRVLLKAFAVFRTHRLGHLCL